MKPTEEILAEVERLPGRERAAALAHYVYMKTAERVGWGKRVPTSWSQLPPDARAFNEASIDTWITEPELYRAWQQALREVEEPAS